MLLNKIRDLIIVSFHKPYDTSTEEGRSKERYRRMALTAITSVIAKIFGASIPLITIKLSFNYLGAELFGLWMAIISFFSLFNFADLGLGNGLRTMLGNAYGKNDIKLSKIMVSSTFYMLLSVSFIVVIIFLSLFKFIDWGKLMNASNTETMLLASGVVLAVVLPKLITIPLSLVARTQLALQEGYKSNLWQSAAVVLSLIVIYISIKADLGKLAMIWGSSLSLVIVSLANLIHYFIKDRKELRPSAHFFDKKIALVLLKTGLLFLILSIFTTLSLALDTFIVAKTSTLEESATYSIIFKLASLISIACIMISTPLWAASSEAIVKGDINWVKKNTRRTSLLSVGISIAAIIFLLVFGDWILKIWISSDFSYSKTLLLGMGFMQLLLSLIAPYFMVLNAANIIKYQVWLFLIYFVISFPLKFIVANYYGVNYIPWVGSIFYLIIVIPFIILRVKRLYLNFN
jgi:O-antigen/teichoic acid export membrane protein